MSRNLSFLIIALILVISLTAGCSTVQNITPAGTSGQPATAAPAPVSTIVVPLTPVLPVTLMTTSSGTCPPNVRNDLFNCGACGNVCPANAVCQAGLCYCAEGYMADNNQCIAIPLSVTIAGNGCPSGMSPCPDGYCYELASSSDNCGVCGNVCSAGLVCSASTCSAPAPVIPAPVTAAVTTTVTSPVPTTVTTTPVSSAVTLVKPDLTLAGSLTVNCAVLGKTSCSGTCVNTSADAANCGVCGNVCTAASPSCCNSGCVNLQTDSSNCGTCGHVCSSLSSCSAGGCTVRTIVKVPVTLVQPVITTLPVYQPIYRPVMP
jgi:hypothetical protein